jgi:glycosyltransferase involved in cell wall biosynthesis
MPRAREKVAEPMRILVLTPWYPAPDHSYRGAFVREHAKAARLAGHEVTVLDLRGGPTRRRGLWHLEEELDPALTEGITTYHVRQRSLPIPGSRGLIYVWSAIRASLQVRARGFQPDVVHAHVYVAGIPGVVVGTLLGAPVVVTEHSTLFPLRKIGRFTTWLTRRAFGRAARVMPVCAFLQRAIEAYGVKARFQLIPNAVDTSVFHPAPSKTRRHSPRRLVFVGNLEPTEHKGFPTLLDALELLRKQRTDWTLDVVGDGPSRGRYQDRVAASPIAAMIAFHGSQSKPEIAEMMRASDLFVLPSRFENQPSAIIEAMASGLPVVSTTVGGIPEMVSEADGILVPPGDAKALVGALDHVLSRTRSYDGRGIAARAAARYGLAAVGSLLSETYAAAVAARGKRASPSPE